MAKKKKESPKPSSLKITRNKKKFVASWNTHSYDKQWLDAYVVKGSKTEHPLSLYTGAKKAAKRITKGATSKTLELDFADYHPNTKAILKKVRFEVKGLKKDTSKIDYSTSKVAKKSFDVKKPRNIKTEGQENWVMSSRDTTVTGRVTFSWEHDHSDSDANIWVDFLCQTVLIKNPVYTRASKLKDEDWKLGRSQTITIEDAQGHYETITKSEKSTKENSLLIIEDSAIVNQNIDTYGRFIRVYARGPGGNSKPAYGEIFYGAVKNPSGIWMWDANDTLEVEGTIYADSGDGAGAEYEYVLSAPNVTATFDPSSGTPTSAEYVVQCPVNVWPGTSFANVNNLHGDESGGVLKNEADRTTHKKREGKLTKSQITELLNGQDSDEIVHLKTSQTLNDDECVFVRRTEYRGVDTNPGDPECLKIGKLADPSGLSITPSTTTNPIIQVTANNNSTVPHSFLAVWYRDSNSQEPICIGIIPHGNSTEVSGTFNAPDWGSGSPDIGVQCMVSDWTMQSETHVLSDQTEYTVDVYTFSWDNMIPSKTVWDGGSVPLPPTNVALRNLGDGKLEVSFDWNWKEAAIAEISWSDDKDAWYSTNEPSTYEVSRLRSSGSWIISGLSSGTWYVRVRFIKTEGEDTMVGTYSDIVSKDISEAPNAVSITISENVIPIDGEAVLSWGYSATDGTTQINAEIGEATWNSTTQKWDYESLPGGQNIQTDSHITIYPQDYGWENNTEHWIGIRLTSSANRASEWSAPVQLTIASKPEISVVTPIHDVTVEIDSDTHETAAFPSIESLPITVTVGGARLGGTTAITIVRGVDDDKDRPDESFDTGYNGEVVYYSSQTNMTEYIYSPVTPEEFEEDVTYYELVDDEYEPTSDVTPVSGKTYYVQEDAPVTFTITRDMLVAAPLDDDCLYKLKATIKDKFGQTDSWPKEEDGGDFYIRWDHKAVDPVADITIQNRLGVTFINIVEPEGPQGWLIDPEDTCDIYRLTVDKPQLIVNGALFGQTYVDPYPTLGRFGGYRIVYRTKYGDYVKEDKEYAWTDYQHDIDSDSTDDYYNQFGILINYGKELLVLEGNISLQNAWKKDFKLTRYLGGSMEGDWNAGVERTGTFKAVIPLDNDDEIIEKLRDVASYAGKCRVRTPDGSNFCANVDINDDREEKYITRKAGVTLTISMVDDDEQDGMIFEQWLESLESE